MTIRQYESLTQDAGKAEPLGGLKLSIEAPGKPAIVLEAGSLKAGKELKLSQGREFIYPTEYQTVKKMAPNTGYAVTPVTPDHFEKVNIGLEAKLTSERKGGLVILKGTIVVTEFQGFAKMGGELGQPILDDEGRVVTENEVEMPKLATYTTPVYVAVQPGKPCKFEISSAVKGAKGVVEIGVGR
jgi:hypothetical protein